MLAQWDEGAMNELTGFILVLYGMIGTFRATELLRRNRLPANACATLAVTGIMITIGGLGLMVGAPVAALIFLLLLGRRGLLLYNQRMLQRRLRGRDFWPGAWPEAMLSLLLLIGSV
jgi:hypothetical protein